MRLTIIQLKTTILRPVTYDGLITCITHIVGFGYHCIKISQIEVFGGGTVDTDIILTITIPVTYDGLITCITHIVGFGYHCIKISQIEAPGGGTVDTDGVRSCRIHIKWIACPCFI